MKTEKEILAMKKEATDIRDKVLTAKATYAEVIKNIDSYRNELKEVGVDPENVEETTSKLENEFNEICEKAAQKIKEWNQ